MKIIMYNIYSRPNNSRFESDNLVKGILKQDNIGNYLISSSNEYKTYNSKTSENYSPCILQ